MYIRGNVDQFFIIGLDVCIYCTYIVRAYVYKYIVLICIYVHIIGTYVCIFDTLYMHISLIHLNIHIFIYSILLIQM